jgi:hypothetical protein
MYYWLEIREVAAEEMRVSISSAMFRKHSGSFFLLCEMVEKREREWNGSVFLLSNHGTGKG